MASLYSRYYDIGRQFIRLDYNPSYPTIIAVLLGGSSIYSVGDGVNERQGCDWDGVIILSTKLAIFQLVNEQRRSLMEVLGIVREECPELRVPDPSSPRWDLFDAVRFAGFDRLDIKRSAKILSLDHFTKPKTSLRILSFKDKRIFQAFGPMGTRFYRVQQATRLEDGLFILHDQLVHAAPATVCVHGQKASFAAFGVTADLLVSGVWLHGHEPYGRLIQTQILANYSAFSRRHATIQLFAKSHRFSSEYTSWLNEELSELYLRSDLPFEPLRCHCSFMERTFLCGKAVTSPGDFFAGSSVQSACLSSQAVELYKQTAASSRFQRPPSVFTSNSTAAEVALPPNMLGAKATKIFCKRSQHSQQEIEGATNAAAFYPNIQLPHVTSSGELLYPFFEGMTESELRLSFHRSGRSDWNAAETVLYAELVKAEDMLRAYRKCLTSRNECRSETAGQPIHRFFHSRLVQNERFREFYGDSFRIGGKTVSMAEFLEIPWKVNGAVYPSLGEFFRTAMDVVHPGSRQSMSCPVVFGLGDAHGANIMIASDVSPNNGRKILYVDYEVAGFHPIMLDLAKSLYIDVFFDIIYMDILQEVPETRYEIEGDLVNVHFTPHVDDITQAIFDVKQRYLLQPLFDLVLSLGGNLEKNVPLLSNALFLCATLTRSYSKTPDAFFRNMATGIILSQAVDLEGLYSCFKTLGIKI
ncbi:MAG: hypothetical protein LQ338_007570 [Usnochroma carphineum]|nr:MAG: hypothetical protein LQ338_007570 [Usnochroma carphineum]